MGPNRLAIGLAGVVTVLLLSGTAASTAVAQSAARVPVPIAVERFAAAPVGTATLVKGGVLASATTVSARSVWAVGATDFGTARSRPLVVRWNGATWKRVPTPRFRKSTALFGVAGTSARDVWAVGEYDSDLAGDAHGKPLILRWNGHTWRRLPSPDPAAGGLLSDVTVVSARDAWAVGSTTALSPLILRWNGTAWKRIPANASGTLLGVAATSAQDAWAVGQAGSRKPTTLILHWNGIAWAKVPNPAGPAIAERVTATSASSAWAVGGTISGQGRALILRWNGAVWTKVRSPLADATLDGVAVSSARSAWAVGATGVLTDGLNRRTVILRWNGRTWTRVRSPRPADHAVLIDVTARSVGDAWAVGFNVADHRAAGLILHWNGTAWK